MIDVSNVTISFEEENQTHVILDDVSLNIEKGEFICLLDHPAVENLLF